MTRDSLEVVLRDMDREAADLITRAAALDYLAGQIEVRMLALDRREREVARREEDVLMASIELKRKYRRRTKHAA